MEEGGVKMRVDASRPAIPSPWPQTPHTFSPHAIHLIRTSVQTNLSLSQMADQKASILMGATFVVFTIAVGQARGGNVSLPLMVLALFAFLSAMCAVFAILPSVRGTPKPKADVPPGATNFMFFGNFSLMTEDDFADLVIDQLHMDETIFRTMLRDVHQNGMVLQHKKYRYLGLAYRLFLIGLSITFALFVVEMALGHPLISV
jgi:hypothetical protein